jgi:hypothetical protein
MRPVGRVCGERDRHGVTPSRLAAKTRSPASRASRI